MGTMFDTIGHNPVMRCRASMSSCGGMRQRPLRQLRGREAGFPKAHVIEIDVDGQGIEHAGDFEAGDMPYAEAGSW